MGKITVETCEIEGLKVITPAVYGDYRGYFMETYNYNDFKAAGIPEVFVQDNQSCSTKGVLRGLHFQINFPQDKLVRVVRGAVYDVAASTSSPMLPSSATSAPISIIRTMRAACSGATRKSALSGRSPKAKSRTCPRRIRSGAASGSIRRSIANKPERTCH